MEHKYLVAFLTFVLTFVISAIAFLLISKNAQHKDKDCFSYITFFSILTILCTSLVLYIPKNDFIYDFSFIELIATLVISVVIFIISSMEKTKKYFWIPILLGSIVLYKFIPGNYNMYSDIRYYQYSDLTIVLGMFISVLLYKYINGIEGIFTIQTAFIGATIFILAIVGASPILIGLFGLVLAAIASAFLSFNTYPAKIKISTAAANSIGFFVIWLLLKNGEESSLSCSVIISIFFITEATYAIIKKIINFSKEQEIYTNTFCYQSNVKGLSAEIIFHSVLKILILMLIFSCLQIYSPNYFSLPFFGLIVMIWFLNKLKNGDAQKQSLKEMNRDFVDNMMDNIDDIKKFINKD